MRAALYLRVSTDDRAVSLDAQESGARAWCARAGHAVVSVYRDDGVSGAEWDERPGVLALQADAERSPRPWDVLVVRDLDRLGRDRVRLPLALSDLADAGVTVVEWSTGLPVDLTDDAFALVQLRAHLAAAERRTSARRTRTALRQKAERGQVTGGAVYGYRNVRGPDGVHYQPHPEEAPVVRELYARHAAGESARALAWALTARGVPAPRGARAWAPSTVHAILRSERYRGVARWGEVGAVYRRGTRRTVPGADVVTYDVPPLVSPEQWTAAQARTQTARADAGRPSPLSREPRYLLIGHAVCGHCGGPLASWRTTHGSGPMAAGGRRVVQTYVCGWRVRRGPDACSAHYARPVEPLDVQVVTQIAAELTPDRIAAALEVARELLQPEAGDARRGEAEARVDAGRRAVARLTQAVALGADDVPELVTALRAARADLTRDRAALEALQRPARALDAAAARELQRHAADARGALLAALAGAHAGDAGHMQDLRVMVRQALPRPLAATWDGSELTLTGWCRPGALLEESAGANTGGADDPNGTWTVPVCCAG